ncbi:MAG: hypothetical protein HY563_00005, partial [Ignavibacteriales bacterium]|nr:hypothetical protein [Ignavibacteriales bacterium]
MILADLRRVASLTVVFIALTAGVSAQDLLQVFLNGGTEGRLTGGNPFVGWEQNWQGTFNHWGSQGFIRYKGRVDNYYREERNDGTSPGLGGVLHAFEAAIPLSAGTMVGIHAESETVLSQALNTRDQIATYVNSRKKVRLTVDTELSGRIRWKVVAGHVTNSSSFLRDMGTGLTLATRYGSASLGVERSTNGQHMALTVGGVSGYLPLEHEHVITRLSFRTEGPFSLELGASHSVISRKVDGPSFRQMQFEPAGIVAAYDARFLWTISSNWKAMGALKNQSMGGHGEFTSEGSRYGAVNGIRYGELSLLAALERTAESGLHFIADMRWSSIRGSLEGFLDSWPFVSMVESPVSARAMFRIHGSF